MRFTRTTLICAGALLLAACDTLDTGPRGTPATVAGTGSVLGPSTGRARDWTDYKVRAAQRIHAAAAGETFAGPLPDPLRSIPVLQVNLNRDGTVRDITVLRTPRQSPETLQMAMRAIRRAAPFEPVGHLPRPWQFNETFLYNDDLKFQLRTLVETAP